MNYCTCRTASREFFYSKKLFTQYLLLVITEDIRTTRIAGGLYNIINGIKNENCMYRKYVTRFLRL